jgi:hypothetical protein
MKKFQKIFEFLIIWGVVAFFSTGDFLYMKYINERPPVGTSDYYDFGFNTFGFLFQTLYTIDVVYSLFLFFLHYVLCRVTKRNLSLLTIFVFILTDFLVDKIVNIQGEVWDLLISFVVFVLLDLFFLKKFPVKK